MAVCLRKALYGAMSFLSPLRWPFRDSLMAGPVRSLHFRLLDFGTKKLNCPKEFNGSSEKDKALFLYFQQFATLDLTGLFELMA